MVSSSLKKIFHEEYNGTGGLLSTATTLPAYGTTCTIGPVWNHGYEQDPMMGDGHLQDIDKRLHKIERKLGGGRRMRVYEVYVVDTKKLVVLDRQVVFGENESDAMSDISLTDEQKALRKRQRIAILANEIGEFEPFAVVHVETEKDE